MIPKMIFFYIAAAVKQFVKPDMCANGTTLCCEFCFFHSLTLFLRSCVRYTLWCVVRSPSHFRISKVVSPLFSNGTVRAVAVSAKTAAK